MSGQKIGKSTRITAEDLKRLLEKATPEEKKLILILTTNHRPGESFEDDQDFEIIRGRAEVIKLNSYYNYPTHDEATYAIIPKTIPVVVRWWHKYDYGTDRGYSEKLYIFTSDGWVSVTVR